MASADRTSLIRSIHASSLRLVLAATGGGAGAIARLLEVPGGSRTVLEARVPYAPAALQDFLHAAPESYCSAATARAMAMAAFQRARALDPAAKQPAGFSCTASLASDRPKRGAHRAYLAAQTATTTTVWSVELQKDRRSRENEEQLASDLLLNLIAQVAGLTDSLAVPLLQEEKIDVDSIVAQGEWQELLARERELVIISQATKDESIRAVLPGAFNPLHQGHRRMAQLAAARLGIPCRFELSISNVDKSPLDFLEIDRRVKQFATDDILLLTCAPTFAEKAKLLPGVTFVVGADTIERVAAARYYASQDAMQQAIREIADAGCRFLVFGRNLADRFVTLDELGLPEVLRGICDQVPQEEFDEPISSTELRSKKRIEEQDMSS